MVERRKRGEKFFIFFIIYIFFFPFLKKGGKEKALSNQGERISMI
jgi:hypothetical protein